MQQRVLHRYLQSFSIDKQSFFRTEQRRPARERSEPASYFQLEIKFRKIHDLDEKRNCDFRGTESACRFCVAFGRRVRLRVARRTKDSARDSVQTRDKVSHESVYATFGAVDRFRELLARRFCRTFGKRRKFKYSSQARI